MGPLPSSGWTVFDAVKSFPPSNPNALIAEIDAAIAATELSRANALLSPPPSPVVKDPRLADEAYKAACAALAAGDPGAALRSLGVALASCPPDRASAMAKLRSLRSVAVAQQHKQQQQQQMNP